MHRPAHPGNVISRQKCRSDVVIAIVTTTTYRVDVCEAPLSVRRESRDILLSDFDKLGRVSSSFQSNVSEHHSNKECLISDSREESSDGAGVGECGGDGRSVIDPEWTIGFTTTVSTALSCKINAILELEWLIDSAAIAAVGLQFWVVIKFMLMHVYTRSR